MTDHPFSRDAVTAVAEEYRIPEDELDRTLGEIQEAFERGDGKYEYSSQHTFGWEDEDAFYLYADGTWETVSDELSLENEHLDPAQAVHRRYMIESANRRGKDETLSKQFTEGVQALVVANTAEGDSLFGQDV